MLQYATCCKAELKGLNRKSLARYALTSLINTSIGILVIAVLYQVSKSKDITIASAALIGYFYSIITYHKIAFKNNLKYPPYFKYAITYGGSYLANMGLTDTCLRIAPNASFLAIQLVVVPLVVVSQWLVSTLWTFRK